MPSPKQHIQWNKPIAALVDLKILVMKTVNIGVAVESSTLLQFKFLKV